MSLAGREKDFDNLMVLMHFAIGQAHLVGTPRGQLTPTSHAEAVNTAVLTCGQSAISNRACGPAVYMEKMWNP